MTQTQKANCAAIAAHYGEGHQLGILQEECAELIQAVSKVRRERPGAYDDYIGELADVAIMLEQMLSFLDDEEETQLTRIINKKLQRQLERMGS